MKRSLPSIIVLTSICLIIAAVMAVVNFVTKPVIAETEKKRTEEALMEVLPSGSNFVSADIAGKGFPSSVIEVYTEDNGGVAVKVSTTGFSSGLQVLVGIDRDGKVTGAKCLASSETLGAEKTYGENFIGTTSADVSKIDTVSGATKTTTGYKNAVRDSLEVFNILKGGKQ